MNRIFKIVFSKAKGMFVVGNEHIRSNGKKSVKAMVAVALSAMAAMGGVAQAGTGSITGIDMTAQRDQKNGTIKAGAGISIIDDTRNLDYPVYTIRLDDETQQKINNAGTAYQAGDNITIDNNKRISAAGVKAGSDVVTVDKDTTTNNFKVDLSDDTKNKLNQVSINANAISELQEKEDKNTTNQSLVYDKSTRKLTLTDSDQKSISTDLDIADTTNTELTVSGDDVKTITLKDSADNIVTGEFNDNNTVTTIKNKVNNSISVEDSLIEAKLATDNSKNKEYVLDLNETAKTAVKNAGTYLSENGIDAKGKKITNVADGELKSGSKEAVNGGQLNATNEKVAKNTKDIAATNERTKTIEASQDGNTTTIKSNSIVLGGNTQQTVTVNQNNVSFSGDVFNGSGHSIEQNWTQIQNIDSRLSSVESRLSDVKRTAYRGIAAVTAIANIPTVDYNKRFAIGVGMGNFEGENAVAIGASIRANENLTFKASVGKSGSQAAYGAGAALSF